MIPVNAQSKYIWLFLLSIFWGVSLAHLPKILEITDSVPYAEITSSTSITKDVLDDEHTLYFFKSRLNWLSLIVEDYFDEPNQQIPLRSEQRHLESLVNIISYQHFQASLSSNC